MLITHARFENIFLIIHVVAFDWRRTYVHIFIVGKIIVYNKKKYYEGLFFISTLLPAISSNYAWPDDI